MALLSPLLRPLLRYWSRRVQPKTEGVTTLAGLRERVTVRWDPFAVPHLFAANERDLFLAQGFLHAQERLWQMDFNRRFHSGRLAEILGEWTVPWQEISIRFKDKTTVDLDYFIRLMGARRTVSASLSLLPQEILTVLEAYSEGVNRYIETHLKSMPVEFRLLRYQPEPWQPVDCLTIGKGFALLLSTALFTRLTVDALAGQLRGQEEKIKSLFPLYPDWGASITRMNSEVSADASLKLLRFINGTFYNSQWAAAGHGSNNWAIAPNRSADGTPILCNDPHLRMTLPPVWYLMGMESLPGSNEEDGYASWGASIPGSPCIYLGHNRRIAWGVTAALCDDVDLYREKIHPQDPNRYRVGDRWEEMESSEEKIRVRGGREIIKTLRFTRHGPVLSDCIGPSPTDEVLSLRWTALDRSEDFRVVYGVNRSRDWKEFQDSLSYQYAPSLNYLYADGAGNIGYCLSGKVPLRPHPPSLIPLPGWSGEFDWNGYVPFNELPRLYNPPEGIVATANNGIADDSYPYYLSSLYDPPYRIERIKELLMAKDKLSLEDLAKIQEDVVSLQAKRIIEVLRGDLEEIACEASPLGGAVQKLIHWDARCGSESSEAALYHVFYQRLMKNLLGPDLGEDLLIAFLELFNQAVAPTDQILADPGSPWFRTRSRHSLVRQSMEEAWGDLKGRLGNEPERWQWGDLHTLTLDHPLGRIGILAPFFSMGPFPAPGDLATVNSGFYRHSSPYAQVVGASLRMVLTPKDWTQSRVTLPSGQSGHPLSPHYRDQLKLWWSGGSISLNHKAEAMEKWPCLNLTPEDS